MRNDLYLKAGRIFFALAMLGIGIVHLMCRNFPAGLLPVPDAVPGRTALVYVAGIALSIAGALMLIKNYAYRGALLIGTVLLLFFLCLHLPQLIMHLHDPGKWTSGFEIVALFAGALILAGTVLPKADKTKSRLNTIGIFCFAVAMLVFGVQHCMYLQFIVTLIPAWVPAREFWAYVVMVAFFLAFISLSIRKLVRLSANLLALMFFVWFLILHIPRVITSPKTETEWTSMFVVLAVAGVSLLIAGSDLNKGDKV